MAEDTVMSLNAGSASLKFVLFGTVPARAASGIAHFDELLNETVQKAPLRRTVEACEMGKAALLLASDYTTAITGEVVHVDAGFHIEGMVFY